MKRLLILLYGTAIVGCVSQSKYDELAARVAKIEGDLYQTEIKSAPMVSSAEPKLNPVKEIEQNVIDTKIDAFICEYLGVRWGDPLDKFPNCVNDISKDWLRTISVAKKFKHFDKAMGRFTDGKLTGIEFFSDFDKKYSLESVNEQVDQACSDLAVSFGLPSDAFAKVRPDLFRRGRTARSSYGLGRYIGEGAPEGTRRIGIRISNNNLSNKLREEQRARENAIGEKLPEAK